MKAEAQETQKRMKLPGASQTVEAANFLPNCVKAVVCRVSTGEPRCFYAATNKLSDDPDSGWADKIRRPWDLHYTVTKESVDSPRQLQRAWRTDAQGNTAEEYRVK